MAKHSEPTAPVAKPPAKRRKTNIKGKDINQAEQDLSPFPFLKLPPEIRNMIYKLVLVSKRGMHFQRAYSTVEKGRCLIKRRQMHIAGKGNAKDEINAKLLRACKQIRNEATVLLYSCNRFQFDDAGMLPQFFVQYATHVRDIRVITLYIKHITSDACEKAFSALVHADQLESLELLYDLYPVSQYGGSGKEALRASAEEFFGVARFWIEAEGIRRGNKRAALKVLTLPNDLEKPRECHYCKGKFIRWATKRTEDEHKVFWAMLRKYLR
ncbi:hypothetical protein CC80DRAFT_562962 [Byssothecium circinans]|uniref:DUF7730 domain-containing protein n=1 Tax=Byssothecium circinans TaxID=147558 RepID=A0A6A5U563_9PLEO|nr:hypothetical protein CC80DRAFT_562962 [Byssothecium circinans]